MIFQEVSEGLQAALIQTGPGFGEYQVLWKRGVPHNGFKAFLRPPQLILEGQVKDLSLFKSEVLLV
jgi:hypothetical protein